MTLPRLIAITVLCLLACSLATPKQAEALQIGYADLAFIDSAQRFLLPIRAEQAKRAGGDFIRINLYWYMVAPSEPTKPSDPADPAYNWTTLDATVREAKANGLQPHFTILGAPIWAQGEDGPQELLVRGAWKPDPAAAEQFGRALARRYSGKYADPLLAGKKLPRAARYEIWNEENGDKYLAPQRENGKLVGPIIYRRLLNGFYTGIKSVSKKNVVLTGGTAPHALGRNGAGTNPLEFWRGVFCLTPKLKRSACPNKAGQAHFDGLSHHPIGLESPLQLPKDPDDITTANLPKLIRTLRAAERLKTIKPAGRKSFWATELWWETNPPDTTRGVSLATQAKWMQIALHQVWKAGGSGAIFLQVGDSPVDLGHKPFATYQTGVFFADGTAKPSASAMRFPVRVIKAKRGVSVWGQPPRAGKVRLQIQTKQGWKPLKRPPIKTRKDGTFLVQLKGQRNPTLRALSGKAHSLAASVG